MKFLQKIPPYLFTGVVIIAILYLTLVPKPFGDEDIPLFPGADKLVHACMFGGLAITFIFDRFRTGKKLSLKGAFTTAVLSAVFGIIIEIVQESMQLGRSGDIYDAWADMIGAFAAVPLGMLLHWVNVVVKKGSR